MRYLGSIGFIAGLAALLFSASAFAQSEVRIATFNIQNFGKTKAGKPAILNYLAEVIREFDLVAVQEISDVSETAPKKFLEAINATGRNYGLLLSERTGKQPNDKTSQEQYAFYYDTNRVEALDKGAIFDDSANDLFQREPYTARFKAKDSGLSFTITQVHTRPESAVAEIKALYVVDQDVATKYQGAENRITLGDFNGSCSYAKPEQLAALEIHGSSYFWIVPDTADTTVSPNTNCAYDRIVLTNSLKDNYGKWGVADWFTDNKISDHWPVWFTLKAVQ